MPKLIRISVDMTTGNFIIERGEMTHCELTEAEKKELQDLKTQLERYGDFVNLGNLSEEERQSVLKFQKRRADLEQKPTKSEIVWHPVPREDVESVVMVLMPQQTPIYVENMPMAWIQKLFKSEIVIQEPKVFLGGATSETSISTPPEGEKPAYEKIPVLSEKHNRVRQIIYDIPKKPTKIKEAKTLLDEVTIREEGALVIVTPKKYLEEDWTPINIELKKVFGKDATTGKENADWIREGKISRWVIKIV